ncbi:unnamed protein product [Owenia fusiformis]|uniref:Thiamine pyrophosphokinase n=1 Tax=Owenia fusiformis TaxID=6347 RepID=A0A8J1UDD1_OWEFU|nr:unnamed protein product [Owenia fusiformis]
MGDATTDTRIWSPLEFLKQSGEKICLMILNQPLAGCLDQLHTLWNKAVLTACVDGGTNELYKHTVQDFPQLVPDIISGDFDSAVADVLQYYKSKGCEIIPTLDQSETDFTKCLRLLVDRINKRNLQVSAIYALCDIGGDRFDHVMANVNTLYTGAQLSNIPTYIVTRTSIICLLTQGQHQIHVEKENRGDWCGFLPIGGRCASVTTTGFKWNLNGDAMEFGGLISSSNTWTDAEVVTIATDAPLVFTMGHKVK